MAGRTARSRAVPAVLAGLAVCVGGARYVNAHAAQTAPRTGDVSAATLPIAGLLNTYCISCHNHTLKTAGLELDRLDPSRVG